MQKSILELQEQLILNVDEAAAILQTTPQTVNKLIRAGFIKSMKVGRTLIRNADLKSFIDNSVGRDYSKEMKNNDEKNS